ncbi:hypothetical protein ACFL6O_00700 [candidate division KSB1 bacterium]
MIKSQIIILVVSLSLLFTILSHCKTSDSPQDIVKKYFTLDYEGERLSSRTAYRYEGLYAWEEEPGWDVVSVVRDFQIGKATIKDSSATVEVVFSVFGQTGGGNWIPSGSSWGDNLPVIKQSENIVFELRLIDNKWVIYRPNIRPHISLDAAIKHLQRNIESYKKRSLPTEQINKTLNTLLKLKEVEKK